MAQACKHQFFICCLCINSFLPEFLDQNSINPVSSEASIIHGEHFMTYIFSQCVINYLCLVMYLLVFLHLYLQISQLLFGDASHNSVHLISIRKWYYTFPKYFFQVFELQNTLCFNIDCENISSILKNV